MVNCRAEQLSEPLHFIGVGGYGMSGLAYILAANGLSVSGCDVKDSQRLTQLRKRGVDVFVGHDPQHLNDVGGVVYSTDVPPDNPEIERAKELELPLLHRSEILARLIKEHENSVAISGTHGKTTTTAMMSQLLESAGMSPTVVIGGDLPEENFTAKLGKSDCLVAEACESDGSFLRYNPRYIIATNLEPEHLEFYDGDFEAMVNTFGKFLHNARSNGAVIVSVDDPILARLIEDIPGEVIRCSLSEPHQVDYGASNIRLQNDSSLFDLQHFGEKIGEVAVPCPGIHMVKNALQVAACAGQLGCSAEDIYHGISQYRGVGRRFEEIGRYEGARVIDDYAHHPTEIQATLEAARKAAEKKVIAIFQPQRYTRTHLLMDEFSQCFDEADELILTPIYSPPGQEKIEGVSSKVLADKIRARIDMQIQVMSDYDAIAQFVKGRIQEGDIVLTMGAGDIWRVAEKLC